MKITCQSCASKYTIADEKVAGKTVKIKCKKCGATIVVNGNEVGFQAAPADPYAQQGAPPDEGGGGAEEGGDGQTSVFTGEQGGAPAGGGDWTVNVADDDQRTMSSAQIAEAYASGIINNDTYVWKDGMGDWSPLSGVPELVALVRKPAAAAAPAPRPAAGFAPPAAAAPAAGLAGAAMMDQAPPAAAPAAAAPPAAARRAVQRETADPFQAREQAVAAATPPPKIDKSVGERNENSMLFSISALTAAKDARDNDRAPAARGAKNGGRGGVDDIMNLGGGIAAAPMLAPPPMLAPVVEAPPPPPMAQAAMMPGAGMGMPGAAPHHAGMPMTNPGYATGMPDDNPYAKKKSPMGLIIGIVAGLAVVGGALAFFLTRPDPNATTTPDQAAVTTSTPTQTAAPTTPTPPTAGTQVAAADTAAPATTGSPSDPGGAKPAVGSNPGTSPGVPGPGSGTGVGTGTGPKTPDPKASATPTAPPEPTPAKTAEAPPPDPGGAEFNRGAATSALGAAAGAAKGCKKPDGPTGSGRVKVTFAPSGNVTSAVVDGPPFAGTPVGGCVASAFRSARVPPFSGAPVTVSKSFNIN
jgi:predicted Zn finger-like uncharacterized protein